MITKEKTKYPGITKITYSANGATQHRTQYRLIIVVGEIPGSQPKRYKQECHTFRTMTEAKAKQDEIKNAKRRGTLVKRDNVTFDELCDRWLNSRHDIREVSRIGYRDALKPAREHLGHTRVQEINRTDIENVIAKMRAQGRSHRTISYMLGTVRQVLNYGISAGLLGVNVAASVRAPRKQHGDTKAVTVWEPKELLQFRAVADRDQWAACWRLTLCGLRRSEVLGLKWDAVDLDQGEIQVRAGRVKLGGKTTDTVTDDPKSTASRRTVPVEDIQPGTVALLRALKARQSADRLKMGRGYPDTGYVLVDVLGRPVRPETYSDHFTALCGEAGVPVIHLHSVRHTVALMGHQVGIAPADMAALLGHTVQIHLAAYVPLTEKGARTAARGLGAAISGFA